MTKLKNIIFTLLTGLCTINSFASDLIIDDAVLFPPYSTDQYIYSIQAPIDKSAHGKIIEISTTIVIKHHILNSGITRIKTTREKTDQEMMLTTVETWITKNPSWAKSWWTGIATTSMLIVCIAAYKQYQDNVAQVALDAQLKEMETSLSCHKTMLKKRDDAIQHRKNILHAKQLKHPHINFDIVDRLTEHVDSDTLEKIIHTAELQNEQNQLSWHDIHHAWRLVMHGNLATEDNFIKNFKKPATFHEIGHAFITTNNKDNNILHAVNNNYHGDTGGIIQTIQAYKNQEKSLQEIDIDLAGLITQQFFHQPIFNFSLRPDLFAGKMLTEKNEILEFLSDPAGKSDIQDARRCAQNILMENVELYNTLTEQQKQDAVDDILVDRYKKTFTTLAINKDKINQAVKLMLPTHGKPEKRIVSGDELYNLWKIDKPLYDFEQGPLPKSLQHLYQYREQ